MVIGLETFKTFFKGFEENYMVIGGTACDTILEEAALTPRATEDIDLILIVEALSKEFVIRFWEFIQAGEYADKQIEQEQRRCYRFVKPNKENFPLQIELFSRQPDGITLPEKAHLTPIPVEEGLSYLSAILLDEEYYNYTKQNSEVQNGLHRAMPHTLICLKAFAFLNNLERKASGQEVKTKDIDKHKYDVFRLTLLLPPESIYETPEPIKGHLKQFAVAIENNLPDPAAFKGNGFGNVDPKQVLDQYLVSFNLK